MVMICASRFLKILKNEERETLWNIKHLRTDFRHDYEHGKEKDIRNKKKLIADAYQKTCGMQKPCLIQSGLIHQPVYQNSLTTMKTTSMTVHIIVASLCYIWVYGMLKVCYRYQIINKFFITKA